MKNLIERFGFLAFIFMALLVTAPVFAKEWSAEQKDVLNSFNQYLAANLKGSVEEIMTYFHPNFIGWDYKQEFPMNYVALQKMMEGFFMNYKLGKFVAEPLEIQVEGNIAILHLNYAEAFGDSAGQEISSSGYWTATMVKQGNKWVFLSWSWIAK